MIAAGAGVLIFTLLFYALFVEPYAIRLNRITMACSRLPEAFDGFTILQITDIHTSKHGIRERLLHRITRGLHPDILAITGDIAYDGASAEFLARTARDVGAREGMYAISGNSDVRYPDLYAEVRTTLIASGIRFLDNEHAVLTRGEGQIVLAGVEDPHTGLDDLHKALAGVSKDTFVFLLTHAPSIAIPAIEMGVDAVISGHTHGGQLAVPLHGPVFTRSGHGKGLAAGHVYGQELRETLEVDPAYTQFYVSRGIGSSFLPIRFLCPPEVTLFTLRKLA